MNRRLVCRVGNIAIGWYLAMSYPMDNAILQIGLSLLVGTFGVFLVGITCYTMGQEDAP